MRFLFFFLLLSVSAFGQTPTAYNALQSDSTYFWAITPTKGVSFYRVGQFVGGGSGNPLAAQWLTYDGDTLQQGGTLNEDLTLDGNGHSYTISNALGVSLNSNGSSGFTVAETAALSLKAGSANQVQINGLGSIKTVNIHADSTQQRMDDGISVIIDAQNNDTWATYEIGANATTTAGGTYQRLLEIFQDGSVELGVVPTVRADLDTMLVVDPATGRVYGRVVVGGGGDGLGAPHQATASLNMDGNEVDSISILNLFDTNGDGTYWTAFEDASGNLIVQSSDAGTDDFTLQPDGDLIITGQLTNNNTWSLVGTAGSSGQYLKSNGDGTTAWDTPAGGSGGGTTEYYFGGQSTQSVDTTLTQDTWEPIRLATEIKKDASFTHSTTVNSHEITLDSTGVYVLSYSVQLNSNAATRMDILTRAQIDTGGGYATLPGSWGALGTFPFAATAIDQFGISVSGVMFSATAGDKIKVEVNVDNENGGDLRFEAGSKVMLQRIE